MTKQWDFCLLGTVASNYEIEVALGKPRSIFVNNQNTVQFWIRRISKAPKHFPNQQYFTCYATDLEKFGFQDNLTQPNYIREEEVKHFLENYLVSFSPARKHTPTTEVFLAKEVGLLRKADSFQPNEMQIALPVYSQSKHGYSFEEFCNRIMMKKYVGKIQKISIDSVDTAKFIIWRENEDLSYVIGPFTSHTYAHGGFCFFYEDTIKMQRIPDAWLDEMYDVTDTLSFMSVHMYDSIHALLEEADGIEGAERETAATTQPVVQESIRVPVMGKEGTFLDHFIAITRQEGLLYAEKDLVNFHTAMKISNLVILQGMSGIGKSKLIYTYAKALGMQEEQVLVIPVRPSWTDDTHVTGYTDLLHMIYRPSDSGLVDVLLAAEQNKDRLYIISFDEMNLARVEHYFSQFLSVLEMNGSRRSLRLYNDHLQNKLYNAAQYPPTISIGDNIMFVGTVNVDESTYHFSDKVLDRANVITLEVLRYSLLQQRGERAYDTYISYEMYQSFRRTEELQLTSEELDLLWDMHEAMHRADARTGIGPRVVRQIAAYLQNLPYNPHLSRADAFDYQIVQRVLTKLRGSEDAWRTCIGMYDAEKDEVVSSQLLAILQKYKHVSSFTRTIGVMKQKAKELKFNGYTY